MGSSVVVLLKILTAVPNLERIDNVRLSSRSAKSNRCGVEHFSLFLITNSALSDSGAKILDKVLSSKLRYHFCVLVLDIRQ